MKKFFTVVFIMHVLMFGLMFAAGKAFKSTVEDLTAEALQSLAGPGQTVIDGIEFSPMSRTITVTGGRSRSQADPYTPARQCGTASARVTVHGMLACLPIFGNLFYEPGDVIPVLTDLTALNIFCTERYGTFAAAGLKADTVSLPYSLALQYSAGIRPPFAEAVKGIHTDKLVLTDVNMTSSRSSTRPAVTARSIELTDMQGASAKVVRFDGLVLKDASAHLTFGGLTLHQTRISPELLSECMAISHLHAQSLSASSIKAILANGPFVERVSSEDITLIEAGTHVFRVGQCELLWQDRGSGELRLRDTQVPASRIEESFPIYLSDMDTVLIDADLSISLGEHMREHGEVHLQQLGTLRYDFTLLPGYAIRDLRATWRDDSLGARIARTIMSDGHGAGMLLKAAAQRLCQRDTDADKAQCARLADFIDRPGTLTLTTVRGPEQPECILDAVIGQRLGSVFNIQTEPGTKTLDRQFDELFNRKSVEASQ